MTACDRLLDLASQIEAEPGPKVQELWREYVVVFLECNDHPEDLTQNSKDIHDLAMEIVGRLENPYITVEDTDAQIGAIIGGRESVCTDTSRSAVHGAADPVTSFDGQFVYENEDLRIAGAGIDFVFTRTYKNQVRFPGPLGFNWNHSYNHTLRVADPTIFRSTGDLRVDAYVRHPKFGQSGFDYWMPPDGQDGVVVEHGNSFAWRAPHGVHHFYQADPDGLLHRLDRIEDRHGNYLQLAYAENRLWRIEINHSDRFVTFSYDDQDRIVAMRDFAGREWSYCYDDFGDLVSVTGPATDRYSAGLTVCYAYSSASYSGALQHNLTSIVDPAGRVYLENEYGSAAGLPSYNRVVRQRQGSGEYMFEYDDIPPETDFPYTPEEMPAHRTIRVERNGQPVCQVFNAFGQLLEETQSVLQDGALRTITWRYRFNRDGALIGTLSPEGIMTQKLFGREYFAMRHGVDPNGDVLTDALTLDERQGFGRLLATVKRARRYDFAELDLSLGVWGDFFPDIIGAFDPADVVAKFTYEPTYGQISTASDPRFTGTPDPAAQTIATGEDPRYEATLTRYAYMGPAVDPASDPTRLLAQVQRPTPTLPDHTTGAPIIDRFVEYDESGRLLRAIDAMGVETQHAYFDAGAGVRQGFRERTVLDPGGLALTTGYEVDDLGRIVAVHAPRATGAPPGQFVTHTAYNALDQVVSVTQPLPFAFVTRRFYDRSGKLEREERELTHENGVPLADGPEVRTFEYDDELHVVRETRGGSDPATRTVKRHVYDRAGQRVLTILPKGNRVRYVYDERLLVVAQITGADSDVAATTRTRYDDDGRVRAVINARGYESTFTCNPFGRVIETEDALGNVIRRDYDKLDQITTTRVFERRADGYYLVARGGATYDELGRAIVRTRDRFATSPGPFARSALANVFATGPIPGGDVLAGVAFYDAKGRAVRTLDALNRETRYAYDAAGRRSLITDALGNEVRNRYDANGNLVRQDRVDLLRDPNNPAIVLGTQVFAQTHEYDTLDRRSASTDALGNVVRYAYDSRGLNVLSVDALGNRVRIVYDVRGRRVQQQIELTATGLGGAPIEAIVEDRYEYDANGNLVRAVDANGHAMQYTYDALDRRRETVYPDGSRCALTFDADGYLVYRRDPNGLQQRFTIDAVGRTTRVDFDASAVTDGPIAGATFEEYVYDALNRRVWEANDFAMCDLRYDSVGCVLGESVSCTIPGAPLAGPFAIERTFDGVGALAGIRYPSGRVLAYTRDTLDRLMRIDNVARGTDYPGDPASPDGFDIARMDFGGRRLSARNNGNGTLTRYAYDGAGRLIDIDHRDSSASLLELQYLYDACGNVRLRTDVASASFAGEAFGYDSLRRLADRRDSTLPRFDPVPLAPPSAPPPDPLPRNQDAIDALLGSLALPPSPRTFAFDGVGNRREEHDASDVTYATNALDQYTAITQAGTTESLQYDRNGNLQSDGTREYVYDPLNRLVRVMRGGAFVAEFFHDVRGRRVMQRTPAAAMQFVWDGANAIEEYRNAGLAAQYVHGEGMHRLVHIAARDGAGTGGEHWYHADLAGSVRMLTTRGGTPAASYDYAPFGELRNATADPPYNPFLYTGQRHDAELHTYDFRAREYDPALGRFLQRDPTGYANGSNLYGYAGNAPLGMADATGTEARPECVVPTREQQVEAAFKPYWERLFKEEERYVGGTLMSGEAEVKWRKQVEKVFQSYRWILQEIQDAAMADRDQIDLKALWNREHDYRGWDWEDKGWMYIHRSGEPSLADVGPFGGERVMGVDVPQVFRITTGNEQPNPSFPVKAIRFVTQAAILFGPDIAMGFEMSAMRRSAMGGGALHASEVSTLPLSVDEFLATRPGDSIALGTYGFSNEVVIGEEARQLGYRTLGTGAQDAARLGVEMPVPNSVRALGDKAIVEHEFNEYLKPADRIMFWLTGREHEFPASITSMELQRVMEDPSTFHKLQFRMNPFTVEDVKNWKPAPGVVTIEPE